MNKNMKELINYLSPFNPKQDDITFLSIVIIASVLIAALIYLISAFVRYWLLFRKEPEEILKSKTVSKVVREYEAGLFEVNGRMRSFLSFQKKVSQEAVLNHFFNDSVLSSVSNVLVGLGVLGTFLGLSKGVSDFNFDDAETMKTGIKALLGGMGTAFVSSIYGMLFSLIFIVVYQFIKHAIFKKLDAFYVSMDDQYLANETEIEAYKNKGQVQNIKKVIEEYFVSDTEEGKITPKEYYHRLLLSSEAQRSSLAGLAEELEITMESLMDKLLQSNTEQFQAIIDEKLVPILEDLRKEKEEGSADVIEQIIGRLETSMKEMITDFKDSISGEAKGEMENLAKQLGSLADSLKDLPAEIKSVSSNVSESMSSLTRTVETIIEKVNKSQEESERKRKDVQDEAADKLSDNMSALSGTVEMLIAKMAKSQEDSEGQIKAIQDSTIDSVKIAVESLTSAVGDVVNKINESQQDNENQIKSIQDQSIHNIEESTGKLTEAVEAAMGRVNKEQLESEEKRLAIQNEATNKLENVLTSVQNNFDSFIVAQQKGSQKLTDIIREVDSILGKNNSTLEQFERVLSNSKEMTERLENGSKSLFEASTSLKVGARAISDNNEAVKGAVTEFVTKNKETLLSLSNIQNEISVKTRDFLTDFGKFENGIEKVFDSFNSGLSGYSDELEKSLNDTAGSYMNKSNEAIKSIGNLASELNEAIEDLSEVLSKTKRK